MIIGIATENNNVSQHFGHCKGFTIYEVENSSVKSKQFLSNPSHKPGFLPEYLHEKGINVIISGGMGAGAIQLFNEKSIQIVTGAQGNVDDVVNNYIEGKLQSSESVCTKHEHHDKCGEHK